MKKLLIAGVLGFGLILGGCATPSGDMLNNKFFEIQPDRQVIAGFWTGAVGPYSTTIKLNADGSGVYCESFNNNEHIMNLKISNNTLYISNGARLKVQAINNQVAQFKNIYFGLNMEYKLYKDDNLSQSSPFCKNKLS